MNYHQKAIILTSNDKGKGKAIYWEDNDGKIKKKTKKFKSPDEMNKIYKEFGFDKDDPMIDVEEFMNFGLYSPFGVLKGLADSFFSGSKVLPPDDSKKNLLPDGVDIEKHRKRLQELQNKKMQEEQERLKKEEDKQYLKHQINELKNIRKELKNADDEEGVKNIDNDIKKIEEKLKNI